MTDIRTLHGAPATSSVRVQRPLARHEQLAPGSPLPGVPDFVPARGLRSARPRRYARNRGVRGRRARAEQRVRGGGAP